MSPPIPTPDEIRSIYTGIDNLPLGFDKQGWNSDGAVFEALIKAVRPAVIIEVGSWKGASAIHMAKVTRDLGLDTRIYAVDLWVPPIGIGLGEFPRTHIPDRFDLPTFYHQFLYNVKYAGADDRIIPMRGLTDCVSWIFGAWEMQADLIYIDARHEEEPALADMRNYWPRLRPGGIMFGDDYSMHPGVKRAVQKFSLEVGCGIQEWPAENGTQWSLEEKPA